MKTKQEIYFILAGAVFLSLALFTQFFNVKINVEKRAENGSGETAAVVDLKELVIPAAGAVIPVKWGDLGKQMVEAGVIDGAKFESLYAAQGGLDETGKKLLYGEGNGSLKITAENSRTVLNLLWALGLGNKNKILEEGPMVKYGEGNVGRFASTGGWTLAKGNMMDHYSAHQFITLSKEQQALVERVSKNIYRPCCGNATYFPDCNHGMAMLGLLELMASQGVPEGEMYKAALKVNSYWFPSTYLTIAKYSRKKGIEWKDVDAKEILGRSYSSGAGYQRIKAEVEPARAGGGGSCGV
ncbi:MAG: hypothetical protein GXP44_00775 [bacterium]|nr:hypothetical protein [bacterium]